MLESVRNNRRLCVPYLLRLNGNIKPTKKAVNEAFVNAMTAYNFRLAETLSKTASTDSSTVDFNKLSIDASAYDAAFVKIAKFFTLDDRNEEALNWLFNGLSGFRPSEKLINQVYQLLYLKRFKFLFHV